MKILLKYIPRIRRFAFYRSHQFLTMNADAKFWIKGESYLTDYQFIKCDSKTFDILPKDIPKIRRFGSYRNHEFLTVKADIKLWITDLSYLTEYQVTKCDYYTLKIPSQDIQKIRSFGLYKNPEFLTACRRIRIDHIPKPGRDWSLNFF